MLPFFSILHSYSYQWLSLFTFSKVISFFLCDTSSLSLTKWQVGKHSVSFKRISQEASPTLASQQAARAETIVRIWHSAIGENGTCHVLQGLLWKFVLQLCPKPERFIFLSVLHSRALTFLSCFDCENQLLEIRTMSVHDKAKCRRVGELHGNVSPVRSVIQRHLWSKWKQTCLEIPVHDRGHENKTPGPRGIWWRAHRANLEENSALPCSVHADFFKLIVSLASLFSHLQQEVLIQNLLASMEQKAI